MCKQDNKILGWGGRALSSLNKIQDHIIGPIIAIDDSHDFIVLIVYSQHIQHTRGHEKKTTDLRFSIFSVIILLTVSSNFPHLATVFPFLLTV